MLNMEELWLSKEVNATVHQSFITLCQLRKKPVSCCSTHNPLYSGSNTRIYSGCIFI